MELLIRLNIIQFGGSDPGRSIYFRSDFTYVGDFKIRVNLPRYGFDSLGNC